MPAQEAAPTGPSRSNRPLNTALHSHHRLHPISRPPPLPPTVRPVSSLPVLPRPTEQLSRIFPWRRQCRITFTKSTQGPRHRHSSNEARALSEHYEDEDPQSPTPPQMCERRALGCYAKAAVYADLWVHLSTDRTSKTINVSERIPNILFGHTGLQHQRIRLHKIKAGYPLQSEAVLLKRGIERQSRIK